MHTTIVNETTFIHNRSFSGEVVIIKDNAESMKIDFEDLKGFVAEYVRNKKISEIELMESDQLLFPFNKFE